MTKSKPWRRFLPILLAVLLALGIALYAVPYAQMVSYRNSAPVQTCAAQLAAAYGEKTGTALSQEDICRDLSYLQRWLMFSDTLPTEIVDLREGRPRYAMPITPADGLRNRSGPFPPPASRPWSRSHRSRCPFWWWGTGIPLCFPGRFCHMGSAGI